MELSVARMLGASNGSWPDTRRYNTQPNENKSLRPSNSNPRGLFGRHESGRAGQHSRCGQVMVSIVDPGEAKIEQL